MATLQWSGSWWANRPLSGHQSDVSLEGMIPQHCPQPTGGLGTPCEVTLSARAQRQGPEVLYAAPGLRAPRREGAR